MEDPVSRLTKLKYCDVAAKYQIICQLSCYVNVVVVAVVVEGSGGGGGGGTEQNTVSTVDILSSADKPESDERES
ncbi:Hypothetical predicted protein [Octopus vulgaris]|uniref:Uncharacterized protein n=1 Tax=Octopus vulgaris TaxID=6645 RepID=A0AA36ATX1_OCTVU|nr:Hypothetical predicted protein [Octopus vulgaris]